MVALVLLDCNGAPEIVVGPGPLGIPLHANGGPYTAADTFEDTDGDGVFDTENRAIVGMADSYFSDIIPEPDFTTAVTLLTDGDHYEDTVSPVHAFATRIQLAQGRIDTRW